MTPIFSASVSETGTLIEPRGLDWKVCLEGLKGKRVDLTIEPQKSKRSLDQLAYLFGVVYRCIADTTGDSVPEIHEVLKRKHLAPQIATFNGKEYKIPGSTTKLNVSQMMEYIEKCVMEANELGITVPSPDQVRI
jgi:hypothetical protein